MQEDESLLYRTYTLTYYELILGLRGHNILKPSPGHYLIKRFLEVSWWTLKNSVALKESMSIKGAPDSRVMGIEYVDCICASNKCLSILNKFFTSKA